VCFAASAIVTKPVPNFTQLDPGRSEIAILIHAMLRARDVVATRPWSSSHEPITESWWADVLADPRARVRRQPRGFYTRHGKPQAQRGYYTLADEPRPIIEVACTKCDWKAAFARAELIGTHGSDYAMPDLLKHLASPRCNKFGHQWDRCGLYCVSPIDWRER
jgi:hypothetical protein